VKQKTAILELFYFPFKFDFFTRHWKISLHQRKGETASPCQISSKSVKPRPRYGDFSIFQDACGRHLGFPKFQIFQGRAAQEGRNALPFQMWSKSVKSWPKYGDFSIFQDGGHCHLELQNF